MTKKKYIYIYYIYYIYHSYILYNVCPPCYLREIYMTQLGHTDFGFIRLFLNQPKPIAFLFG